MSSPESSPKISPVDLIQFWYSAPMNQHWFKSTSQIDVLIRDNYELVWRNFSAKNNNPWKASADGCLALILLFDQFPLNMFRGTAESFATEAQAIELTLYGIEKGYDEQLPASQLNFFYMPLMHSENLQHQDLSIEKFEQAGLKDNARFAKHHRDIVERFGRFPHRNSILGRNSTPDESAYLESDQAFKG